MRSVPYRFPLAGLSITCDGNSITAGATATASGVTGYPATLARLPFCTQNNIIVKNVGIGGQAVTSSSPAASTQNSMLAEHGDVDAAFDVNRTNILLAWELTNSIGNGELAAAAVADLALYCAAVKGSNSGWKIGMMTALPRYQGSTFAASSGYTAADIAYYNAQLDAANILLRSQYRQFADFLVDLRCPGSPFNLPDYSSGSFSGSGLFTQQADSNNNPIWVHPNDYGYSIIALMVEQGLRRYVRH